MIRHVDRNKIIERKNTFVRANTRHRVMLNDDCCAVICLSVDNNSIDEKTSSIAHELSVARANHR
jgi:hypothetical protein